MSFKYIETKPRSSRTQKRREAKLAKKQEQDKRIADCAQLDEHRERRIEEEKLGKLLRAANLRLHNIEADGDCLYRAIEHQLSKSSECIKKLTFQELREATSNYMLENPDNFLPFLTTESGDLMNKQEYENYCHRIARTKEWGGNAELSAIANIIEKPIHIFQADSRQPIIIEPSNSKQNRAPILLSFHKYLYHLGEHYNSLEEVQPNSK